MYKSYIKYKINDISIKNKNEKIVVEGWVHRIRNHGNLFFIDLRDHTNILQLVHDNKDNSSLSTLIDWNNRV
jgi:aspartyl-tRNA synthetase